MWTTVGIISFSTYGLVRLAPSPTYYWRVRILFIPIDTIFMKIFSGLDCYSLPLFDHDRAFNSSMDFICEIEKNER